MIFTNACSHLSNLINAGYISRFKALNVVLYQCQAHQCAAMMTWWDLGISPLKVTLRSPLMFIQIGSSLMLITTSSFDTCSLGSCWRRWHRCPNKTVVTVNKSVIHISYSSAICFQVKEQCFLPLCTDSQGLVGIAPCGGPVLLFTSLNWTQGESILLSDRSVNSLHPIFTDIKVQTPSSCYHFYLPHPSLYFWLSRVAQWPSLLDIPPFSSCCCCPSGWQGL